MKAAEQAAAWKAANAEEAAEKAEAEAHEDAAAKIHALQALEAKAEAERARGGVEAPASPSPEAVPPSPPKRRSLDGVGISSPKKSDVSKSAERLLRATGAAEPPAAAPAFPPIDAGAPAGAAGAGGARGSIRSALVAGFSVVPADHRQSVAVGISVAVGSGAMYALDQVGGWMTSGGVLGTVALLGTVGVYGWWVRKEVCELAEAHGASTGGYEPFAGGPRTAR